MLFSRNGLIYTPKALLIQKGVSSPSRYTCILIWRDAGRPLYVGIIIWKRLIHYGPLVMGFHRSLVDSPRKLPIMRNLEIPLEVHWISFGTNSRVAGFSDAMTPMCWWKPWSSCDITLIMNQTTNAHLLCMAGYGTSVKPIANEQVIYLSVHYTPLFWKDIYIIRQNMHTNAELTYENINLPLQPGFHTASLSGTTNLRW